MHDFDRNSSLPRKGAPRPAPKPSPAGNGGVMVKNAPSAMVMEQPAAPRAKSANSIDDFIREIITEQPDAGTFKIKQLLATPRFGMHRLSWFDVRRRLKEIGLDSKQKRVAFLKQKVG